MFYVILYICNHRSCLIASLIMSIQLHNSITICRKFSSSFHHLPPIHHETYRPCCYFIRSKIKHVNKQWVKLKRISRRWLTTWLKLMMQWRLVFHSFPKTITSQSSPLSLHIYISHKMFVSGIIYRSHSRSTSPSNSLYVSITFFVITWTKKHVFF